MTAVETRTLVEWRYLRPEDVARLKSYEFAPRLLVEGYLAGRHRSPERGRSVEFRDYRGYAPGDDVRSIDWKVLARCERYFVRLFEEETDVVAHVFLDSSASMGFGGVPTKLEYSSFFAAALCFLVTRCSDKVSLTLFDDGIRKHVAPGGSRYHLTELMHVLEHNRPGRETRLSSALRKMFPLLRKKGILVIVSDFFDSLPDIFASLNMYLHRGHEVVLFHVLAPEEMELAGSGQARFRDMENSSEVEVFLPGIKKAYRDKITAFIRNMRTAARKKGIEYVFAGTDTHYFRLFERYLKKRGAV